MAVTAAVFDLGGTLIDETGMWERAADTARVPSAIRIGLLDELPAALDA